MRTEDLQVVYTKGNHKERARQYAEATRERVNFFVETYNRINEQMADPVNGKKLRDYRNKIITYMRKHFPYYFDILEGCAQGANRTSEEILDTLISIVFGKSKMIECSGIAIYNGKRVILGQNWDASEDEAKAVALEVAENEDKLKAVRFSWAANPLEAWIPINWWGLSTAGASGGSYAFGDGIGLPVTIYRRMFFDRCKNVKDVKNAVIKHPMIGKGANHVFADPTGTILGIELGGGAYAFSEPENNIHVMTGHRINLKAEGLEERPPEKREAEHKRRETFIRLCNEIKNKDNLVAQMKKVLAFHDNGTRPDSSPCRHGGPNNSTQYSFVADITERKYYYCGRPCENEWRKIDL